jgi:hypothetical protein
LAQNEGGISFWLPGLFGSLAAAPQVPGWALGIVNYYANVSATGNVGAAREVTIGRLNPSKAKRLDSLRVAREKSRHGLRHAQEKGVRSWVSNYPKEGAMIVWLVLVLTGFSAGADSPRMMHVGNFTSFADCEKTPHL